MSANELTIGLISDTHGLLRPEARAALAGVDRILHAGDICTPVVLEELARIAPVVAVRGNNDRGEWAEALNEVEIVDAGGTRICIVHDVQELEKLAGTPDGASMQVVVSGHSHRPSIRMESGILFVNPGSAGPRRFRLPVSLGYLHIENGQAKARLRTLETD